MLLEGRNFVAEFGFNLSRVCLQEQFKVINCIDTLYITFLHWT
jgi:hypothetical protein